MYLVHSEETNFRSRLEAVADGTLSVAAPLETTGADELRTGQQIDVFWALPRARVILPCRLVGIAGSAPFQWTLEPIGSPRASNRREFVRGGGGPAVQLASEPVVQAPVVQAPDHQAPDHQAPDHQGPDHQAPDHQAPDHQAPDHQAPDDQAPVVQASDDQALADQTPEVRTLDGRLLDISEGGLRCWVPAAAGIKVGDRMAASLRLETGDLEVEGTVFIVRDAFGEAGQHLVVTFQSDETTARLIRRHVFACELAERRRSINVQSA
jgi:hypothetical protein